MATIKDWARGTGAEVETGYRRGDSWVQTVGDHADCAEKVMVLGPGIGRDSKGRKGAGVLVRCFGCFGSWVIR